MDESRYIRALIALAAASALLTLCASIIDGPPRQLPDVALGWAPILYAERAAFVAALILGAGSVAVALLTGLRIRSLGGGPLPAIAFGDDLGAELTALADRVLVVERRLDALERRLLG